MTANPLSNPQIESLARISFQVHYLRRMCGGLLAGDRSVSLSWLFNESQLKLSFRNSMEAFLSDEPGGEEIAGVDVNADSKLIEFLQQFHHLACWRVDELARHLMTEDGTLPPLSVEYVRWAWRKNLNGFPQLSDCSWEGILVAHDLLLCHLAQSSSSFDFSRQGGKKAEPQMVLDRLKKRIEGGAFLRANTGESLSHFLAIEGLRFTLNHLDFDPGNVVAQNRPIWEGLHESLRPLLARFLSENVLVHDIYQDVGNWVCTIRPPKAQGRLSLIPRAERSLLKLENFGKSLVFKQPGVEIKKPILMGRIAADAMLEFACLDSPAITRAEADDLRQKLISELAAAGSKLMRTTVRPRPALYNNFIGWAAQFVVMTKGVHFPLSDICLEVLLLCYELLAADHAVSAEDKKIAVEALAEASGRVASAAVSPGDMLLIYRAMIGLHGLLAARHGQQGNVDWALLIEGLKRPVAAAIKMLAAKSPIVRFAIPSLAIVLQEEKVLWAGLAEFLDDPQADALRDFSVGRLVAEVIADRALLVAARDFALEPCLAVNSIGGTLIVAEFLQVLLQRIFTPCEMKFGPRDHYSEKVEIKDMKPAAEVFSAWFLDLAQPIPRAFFELFVGCYKRVLELKRNPETASDPRTLLLLKKWNAMTHLATRGLTRRPWRYEAQNLLRLFWLNFAVVAYEHFQILPDDLGTGIKQIDNLPRFSSWTVAQLERSVRNFRVRKHQAEREQQELNLGSVSSKEIIGQRLLRNEFLLIENCLKQRVLKNANFCSALVVRRVLVASGKTKENLLVWNQERIDELTADPQLLWR